jgi:asparagine synthase (glutamine-hydrolysing)
MAGTPARGGISMPLAHLRGWVALDGRDAALEVRGARTGRVVHGSVTVAVAGRIAYAARDGRLPRTLLDCAESIASDWLIDGSEVLNRCDGEFALAVHNAASGEAIVAVDRFASRAMYVAHDDLRLAFGPDPKEVLATLGLPATLSNDAVYAYCYFHMIPAPLSIWKGVARLDVAESCEVVGGVVMRRSYWRPDFVEPRQFDFEHSKADFKGALKDAVARCVQDIDPDRVGCFLSGGTDSSTLAGMFREATGGPARTFSIGFDVDGYDERRYARIASAWFDTKHVEYVLTPQDVVEGVDVVARAFEQPFGNASAVPTFFCARLAKEHGIDRMLGGDGGDELFGGNERYAKQRVFGHYERLPEWFRASMLESWMLKPAMSGAPLPLRKASSYVQQAKVPLPDRLHTYNPLVRLGSRKVFEEDFLATLDPLVASRIETAVWTRSAPASQLNRLLAYDFKFTLGDNDLRKVGQMCEAAGLEAAYPMLAATLVDLSLRLPSSQKLHGSALRYFFKRALTGFLPDEIIKKPKHGFGMPFGEWMLRQPMLLELTSDAMAGLANRGILKHSLRVEILDAIRSQHAGYYGTVAWLATVLELWLRAHVDAA